MFHDFHERDRVILEVKRLASLEEISLRQKSRVLWLKEGDNNSKFSHQMANSHRKNNYLGDLEVDGVVYEDKAEVVAQVVGFYQKLYKETETWQPVVDDLNFDTIGEVENGLLERRFKKEEILQVVRDMEGGQSPKT